MYKWGILYGLIFMVSCLGQAQIPHGHAHNDYKQQHPLIDALNLGYGTVEVDVFSHKGSIHIAHTKFGLPFSKTLKELYLDPLVNWLDKHDDQFYSLDNPLVLMIDLKSNHEVLIQALEELLVQYADYLVRQEAGVIIPGLVQIVLSGGVSADLLENQTTGFLFGDCPMKLFYYPSDDCIWCVRRSSAWSYWFSWKGKGQIPEVELQLLQDLVSDAHQAGYKLRFWAIPDTEACWDLLLDSGVDWINIDDLDRFDLFYQNRD